MSRPFSKFSKKSPLEVDRFISDDVIKTSEPYEMFPSPLEVNRFISDHDIEVSENPLRYRPLAR